MVRLIREWANLMLFKYKLRRATPVFIYQMGKVGSSSIYNSLLRQYRGAVLHAHSFSLTHDDRKIRELYRHAILKARPLNVISLTREPIGRNISAFFQNFKRDTGVPYSKADFTVDELKALFLSNYRHEIPLEWFDNNILKNFDIDVYTRPFSQAGSATYLNRNIRLLIMRMEISDNEKEKAISDFLELPGFHLQNTNIGEGKSYSKTYKAFRREAKFPYDYVAAMCESKYFMHFYSRETIENVRMKWS